jgi:hypothetical protein
MMMIVLLLAALAMHLARVVRVVNNCGSGRAGGAGEALLGIVAQQWGGTYIVPLLMRCQGRDNAHHHEITSETSRMTAKNGDTLGRHQSLQKGSNGPPTHTIWMRRRPHPTCLAPSAGGVIALKNWHHKQQLAQVGNLCVSCILPERGTIPMCENQRQDDWALVLNNLGCAPFFCSMANVHLRARTEALLCVPLIHWEDLICFNAHKHGPYSFLRAMAQEEWELLLLRGGSRGTRRTTTATTTMTTAMMTMGNMPEDLGIVAPYSDGLANLIYTSGATGAACPRGSLTSWMPSASRFARGMDSKKPCRSWHSTTSAGAGWGWSGG